LHSNSTQHGLISPLGTPWLIRYRRNPDAATRLFCFHCAGGSASEFRGWSTQLPGKVELLAIQLPGREGRVKEPFLSSIDELVNGVVEALTPLLDKPYAFFGHSFGTVCGFEVIRELRRRGLRQPFLFIPAGRQAPHVRSRKPPIASLPRESFIEELRKEYGDHIGHVLESAELRDVFIPQIHADFSLSEGYRCGSEQPLDCSIVAFAGVKEDELLDEDLDAWSVHTSRSFHSRRFPGDHFFIRGSQAQVVEAIKHELAAARRERTATSQPLPV
jgi:surfactin synthase thioesterase subunit